MILFATFYVYIAVFFINFHNQNIIIMYFSTPNPKRFFFILFLFIFSTWALHAQKTEITEYKKGCLNVTYDIPILTVKGSHYEMGLQYGYLLNDRLIEMNRVVDSLIDENLGSFFLKRWIGRQILAARINRVDKRMPACFVHELEGIAENSALSLREVKTIAYFPQVFFEISCSSFILKDHQKLLHGRNLDWNGIDPLVRFPLIVNYHPTGRHAFTVATFIGYPGVYTAMNHHGLSISINMNSAGLPKGIDKSQYQQEMPSAYKTREILEKADNLQQVDSLLNGYKSHGWFFIIASLRDNSGCVYELTRGKIFPNKMQGNFLAVENLALSEDTRKPLTPISCHSTSNTAREYKIAALQSNYSSLSAVDKTYKILSDVSFFSSVQHPAFYCSINNAATVHSCILDLVENKLYFAYGKGLAAFQQYYEYDIPSGGLKLYKQQNREVRKKLYPIKQLRHDLYNLRQNTKKRDGTYYAKAIVIIDEAKVGDACKWYYKAKYYTNQGEYELAIVAFTQLLKALPEYDYAHYHLARVYRKHGKLKAAQEQLDHLDGLPEASRYYHFLGQCERILLTLQKIDQGEATISDLRKERRTLDEMLKGYFIDEFTQEKLLSLDKKIKAYTHG